MNYNPFTLEGKVILVTGASSGIGRAAAIECSRMGAKMIILGRDEERLKSVYAQLEGGGHLFFHGDLTDDDFIASVASSIEYINGIVFCAGISDTTMMKFATKEKFLRILDINLFSEVELIRLLLQKKKVIKSSSLVFVSSMGAKQVAPGLGLYSASKSAILSIMKALAIELVPRKIRANAVLPSMVRTPLIDKLSSISQEEWELEEKTYPLGFGQPEDIAYACIYLLSDASRWVTGTELKLDGGKTLN